MWKTLEEYIGGIAAKLSLPPFLAAVPVSALRIYAERMSKALHAAAPSRQGCQVLGRQPREQQKGRSQI